MQLFRTYVSRFFLGLALLLSISAANAALIKSYDFNAGLTDTLGNGDDLVRVLDGMGGMGHLDDFGFYTFGANQGLQLTNAFTGFPGSAINQANYGIEIGFRTTETDDDHKLIDFQNRQSGNGFYIVDGAVQFYDTGVSVGSFDETSFPFTLGLSRTAGASPADDVISLFFNDILLQEDADPNDKGVSIGNTLNFFVTDIVFPLSITSGEVDFIRIHEDSSTFGTEPVSAVPIPATIWLFSTALIGLIGLNKRKARIAA